MLPVIIATETPKNRVKGKNCFSVSEFQWHILSYPSALLRVTTQQYFETEKNEISVSELQWHLPLTNKFFSSVPALTFAAPNRNTYGA
jgi:hypothetical protein